MGHRPLLDVALIKQPGWPEKLERREEQPEQQRQQRGTLHTSLGQMVTAGRRRRLERRLVSSDGGAARTRHYMHT